MAAIISPIDLAFALPALGLFAYAAVQVLLAKSRAALKVRCEDDRPEPQRRYNPDWFK